MRRAVPAVAVLAVLALLAAAAWFVTRRSSPAPAPAAPAAAASGAGTAEPSFALSGRLVLEPAGSGEPALGIIRLFDLRARNGLSQGGASVVLSRAAIDAGVALEIEQADGQSVRGVKPVVVQAPADGPQQVQRDTTIELRVDLPTLPAAGSRVRISVPIGSDTVITDWVEVPPAPESTADALAARARVQRAKRDPALRATADQLIAEAPSDARGYYYRGLALEQQGDRAGAIAAYEAALERISGDGQEPPVGLYQRLARLRAGQ